MDFHEILSDCNLHDIGLVVCLGLTIINNMVKEMLESGWTGW
jgi:hypothetical protein